MTVFLHQYDLPEKVSLGNILAIDTETMGLNRNRDRLCMVQISDGNGDAHLVHFPAPNYAAPNLKKILADKDSIKIFHYARFDVATIYKYLDVMIDNIFCTKIASRLARTYTDSHGLKDVCRELLGVAISKEQQSSDWGNSNISKDQQQYAANDVLYLHKLKEKLDSMLTREKRSEVAYECFKFLPLRVKLDMLGWENDIFSHSG